MMGLGIEFGFLWLVLSRKGARVVKIWEAGGY